MRTYLRLEMRAGNDAAIKRYLAAELAKTKSGTPQFTCFTGTKVHILTRRKALLERDGRSLLALLVQKYKY
jgi:hypothetical protein